MSNVFRTVSGTLNKFVDCVYLGVLWFVCSIPIFTIGASCSALYYAVHKAVVHERSYVGKEFFHCFKKNFKQATLLWLGILLFAAAMIFGAYQSHQGLLPAFFLYIYIIILALILMTAVYAFPYLSRFEDCTSAIIKNCLVISAVNFGKTLVLLLVIASAAVAVWIIPPLIIILPAFLMRLIESIEEKIFCKYLSEEALQQEFRRNRSFKN